MGLARFVLAVIGAASITLKEFRGVHVGVCEACGAAADIRDREFCPDCGAFLDPATQDCVSCGEPLHLAEALGEGCPECGCSMPF